MIQIRWVCRIAKYRIPTSDKQTNRNNNINDPVHLLSVVDDNHVVKGSYGHV